MKKTLLILSIVLLAFNLVATYFVNSSSKLYLKATSEYVSSEVGEILDVEMAKVNKNKTVIKARSFLDKHISVLNKQIDNIEEAFKEEIPKMAKDLTILTGKIEDTPPINFDPNKIQLSPTYFKQWVRYQYVKTLNELKYDLNIFLISNMIVLFMALFVLYKIPESKMVSAASIAIIIAISAVIISSLFYFYSQDWFYNILHSSYFGFGYSIFMLIIFGILADLAFNRGRITKFISFG